MSKKYIGKHCAYCVSNSSVTADHVFAREFFLGCDRANLPKVPACTICNNKKSELEHYLTAVLPFGARHEAAYENLSKMVPRRLNKNLRLKRFIQSHWRGIKDAKRNDGNYKMILPIQSQKVLQLFDYIVRGLTVYHWEQYLDHNVIVDIYPVTDAGEKMCEELLNSKAENRVTNDLGNGTIIYEGAQGLDYPQLTVWRIEMYGRMQFANSSDLEVSSSCIFVLTSLPKELK
jgi:hypothetical protein